MQTRWEATITNRLLMTFAIAEPAKPSSVEACPALPCTETTARCPLSHLGAVKEIPESGEGHTVLGFKAGFWGTKQAVGLVIRVLGFLSL